MRRLAARRTWPAPPPSFTPRPLRITTMLVAALAGGWLTAGPGYAAPPEGTLRGKVVDATEGEPRAGVAVTLIGARPDGTDRTTEKVETDPRGRYRFEGLTPGRIYAVQATFDGGLFAGSPIRMPTAAEGAPVVDSTLRVWATTSNPAVIEVTRNALFLSPSDDDLGVIESVVVTNSSPRAYIGRAGGMGGRGDPGATPTLGFSLPARADPSTVVLVDSSWDGPPPVATDFGFGATVAIPPGETSTTFSYRITGSGGVFDASRTVLYPTSELVAHAAPPLGIEGNRFVSDGSVRVAGRTYRRWTSTDRIEAGNVVQIAATARAGIDVRLLGAGIAAGLVVLVAAGMLLRRRRSPRTPASDPPVVPPATTGRGISPPAVTTTAVAGGTSRKDVIAAIASLDLEHDAGRLGDEEWLRKRDVLKRRLGESSSELTP